MNTRTSSLPRYPVILVISFLVIGFALVAYARQSALASGPGKDSLAEAAQGFKDAFLAKDPEKISSYFAQDTIAMYPLDTYATFGYEANRQGWLGAFDVMTSHPVTVDLVVTAESKDIGYTYGRWAAFGIPDVGDLAGRYVAAWKWTKSGWKITLLSAHVHDDVLPSDVAGAAK